MLIPLPGIAASKWSSAAGPAVAPAAAGIAAWKIAVGVAVVALAGGGGFTLAARQATAPAIHDQSTMAVGGRDVPRLRRGPTPRPGRQSPTPHPHQGVAGPRCSDRETRFVEGRAASATYRASHVPRALPIVFLTSVRCWIAHAVRSFGATRPTRFRRFVRTRSRLSWTARRRAREHARAGPRTRARLGSARAAGERFHRVYARILLTGRGQGARERSMTLQMPVRATALGLLALAGVPGCASHMRRRVHQRGRRVGDLGCGGCIAGSNQPRRRFGDGEGRGLFLHA